MGGPETEVTFIPKGKHATEHQAGGVDEVKFLTVAETEVFSGAGPNQWADLDLHLIIGVNPALLLLKITGATIEGHDFAFRKNGDTDEFCTLDTTSKGAAFFIGTNDVHSVVLVTADSSGIIEWKNPYEDTVTVDIIAYIK